MDYLQEKIQKILDDYILSRKLRKTKERNTILSLIYEYPQHFTVEELYIFMKKKQIDISRATLYNTIELLLDCNLVVKHQFGKNIAQFERAFQCGQHDHLIDIDSGRVIEFCDPRISEIIRTACELNNFTPQYHSLYIYGNLKEKDKKKE